MGRSERAGGPRTVNLSVRCLPSAGNVQSLDLVVGHEITKFLPGILYARIIQTRLVVFQCELDRHLGPSSKFWINRKDRSSAAVRCS
jgi:hypothetical protein